MSEAEIERHRKASHAVQTGLALQGYTGQMKHLRVGLNVAMCDHAALVRLLVETGILTDDEYLKAAADEMEREVERIKEQLRPKFGDVELH